MSEQTREHVGYPYVAPGEARRLGQRWFSTSAQEAGAEEPAASPHHVGFHAGLHPEDMPSQSGPLPRPPSRGGAPLDTDLDAEEEEEPGPGRRLPTSARRYSVPARRSGYAPPQVVVHEVALRRAAAARACAAAWAEQEARPRPRLRLHGLLSVGVALLVMIAGWLLLSALATWWQTTLDDWHYGRPRTFQVDAVVGHGDSPAHPSHFVALNLSRHVLIIELPGGEPSRARIYSGPVLVGDGQDLTPVTLSFRDANGDGKPDLVVQIGDQRLLLLNQQGQFVPQQP